MIAMAKRIVTKDLAMELRTDFARRELVLPGGEAWRPSPTGHLAPRDAAGSG
jgi:hypothetical protein